MQDVEIEALDRLAHAFDTRLFSIADASRECGIPPEMLLELSEAGFVFSEEGRHRLRE